MKKVIALLLVLSLFTVSAGCDSNEENETDVIFETTTAYDQCETFDPDKLYEYHEISFMIDYDWKIDQTGTDIVHFICPSDYGTMSLKYNDYTEDISDEMFKKRINTYCDMPGAVQSLIDVNGISVQKIGWKSNGGREKTYIFMYDNCVYQIDFYLPDDCRHDCAMYLNSDVIINSLFFGEYKNTVTTTHINTESTTYTSAPQQNSTEMVDKLTSDAKLKAETATPEELQKALDNLRALSGNFYTSNDTMHSVIYNSQLLYYYYKDTNTPYEQAGFYAFVAVKYVYRGIDTADSEDTADNLTKFAASLMQCDDIYTSATAEETQAQTQPETQPETQAIYTVPPVQQGQTVYVTPTGKKYHYDSNCNGGSYNPTDLDTAKRMGLEPCKKCT